MSGNASSGDDELPGRVFDDLHEHELARGAGESTEPGTAADELLLGRIALEWKLVDRAALEDCIREREAATGLRPSLEELFVRRGILKPEVLASLLQEKKLRIDGLPDIPRYEIRERIGEGATAVVYGAWDRQLKRGVAIKVLRDRSALDPVAELRFRREARTAAGLSHPNIVTVYDAGEADGRLYIVMELVEGRSLKHLLRDPRAPRMLEKAARGVAAAHQKGVVHRDLKPANILVSASGEPKVGDFGLAHLLDSDSQVTATGAALGTPLYMSPEQVRGDSAQVSPRTDVYALGAMLYEALSGAPPYPGDTAPEIYRKILEDAPVDVPGPLGTIALKALEKDSARRYPGAAEFADDLRRALDGEPILARRPGWVDRLLRRARRNAAALAVSTMVGLGLLGVWIASARLREERDVSVATLRETARLSLEAALQRREKGENAEMRRYLPALEQAYEGVRARGARSAEIEYLMGRMHRALMDVDKALGFQEEALRKDPSYGPALYERAVLLSRKWESQLPEERLDEASRRVLRDGLDRLLKAPKGVETVGFGEECLRTARGMLAYLEGRLAEAREILERAVKENPNLEEAWEALALVAAEQARTSAPGKREQSWLKQERILTQAILKDRGFLPHLLARGDLKRDRGNDRANRGQSPLLDLRSSEEDYSEVLRLKPESQDACIRRAIVRTLRGIHLTERNGDPLKDFADAEADLDRLEKLAPESATALGWRTILRVLRGTYLESRGRDPLPEYEGAVQDATETLRRNPQAADGWKRRGIARLHGAVCRMSRNGDPAEDLRLAEEDLAQARGRSPDQAEIRMWQGLIRLRAGEFRVGRKEDPAADFAAGETFLGEALDLNRDYVRAWMWRGVLRLGRGAHAAAAGGDPLGDYDAARPDLTRALQLNPGYAEAWRWRGVLAARRGANRAAQGGDPEHDFTSAAEDFAQALTLDPGSAEAWAERGRLRAEVALHRERKGEAAEARKGYAAAAEDLQAAIRLNPALQSRLGAEAEGLARKAKEGGR